MENKLRILKIIHGYPPLFNAGSEVYSRNLCHGLVEAGHQVAVFTRFEDPFIPDYEMIETTDPIKPSIILYQINMARDRDRYCHKPVDQQLKTVITNFQPDIVHIGHLNHLSTSMIEVIANFNLPLLFTLHDYWLMCPRGQFLQTGLGEEELWALCTEQEDKKCALKCYSRYFSGLGNTVEQNIQYWTNWINGRMHHIKNMIQYVQLFVAPSRHLYQRFVDDFSILNDRIVYLDYGFDQSSLSGRKRNHDDSFVFGYIGTHIPAKGIQHLIHAFSKVKGKFKLRIFGRVRPENTAALKRMISKLSEKHRNLIEWYPEYKNNEIVNNVFNLVDAIIVPSIWDENSPLVIHEAQQVRIPIITANHGGMKEYVSNEVNGLLFQHRNVNNLAKQMQRFVNDPQWAKNLGKRGYLYSDSGDIPSMDEHVKEIGNLYEKVLANSK